VFGADILAAGLIGVTHRKGDRLFAPALNGMWPPGGSPQSGSVGQQFFEVVKVGGVPVDADDLAQLIGEHLAC